MISPGLAAAWGMLSVRSMRRHLLIPFLLLPACAGEDIRTGTVASTLSPCMQIAPSLCMTVMEEGAEGPQSFGIRDFTFEWGVEKTITYSVEEIDDPPADGSSIERRGLTLISTRLEPAGTQFVTSFPDNLDNAWLSPDIEGIVSYGGYPVACASPLREEIGASRDVPFRVTFEHTGGLVALRCVALEITP
jgi:hypothetical protein